MTERGTAPDERDIFDITATEECNSCSWAPAVLILVDGEWECYNCGRDPDYEFTPTEPADFGGGESTGVQDL
jgi:hypothetical protein